MTGRMRKHNIERETEMEREGKRVYVERTIYLKGMKHIKARKRKTNTSSNSMRI